MSNQVKEGLNKNIRFEFDDLEQNVEHVLREFIQQSALKKRVRLTAKDQSHPEHMKRKDVRVSINQEIEIHRPSSQKLSQETYKAICIDLSASGMSASISKNIELVKYSQVRIVLSFLNPVQEVKATVKGLQYKD